MIECAFFGTLGQLQDRKDAKEDREGERRWKAFYMEHLQGQEARAQESHEQDMAKWEVEKEGMLREAEAREEFFAKYDVTPESWAMMAPMEQFAMAKENFAMAKELHTLDLESRRFDLGVKQRMAPLEEARARYDDALPIYREVKARLGEANTLQSLGDLLVRTDKLYDRVLHLDRRMYLDEPEDDAVNPVQSQLDRLTAAFRI